MILLLSPKTREDSKKIWNDKKKMKEEWDRMLLEEKKIWEEIGKMPVEKERIDGDWEFRMRMIKKK